MASPDGGMFDGIFMQVVQQSQGIEGFFDQVFSFLRRKTDFFSNQSFNHLFFPIIFKKIYRNG